MNPMQNNRKEIHILTYSKPEKFQEKGKTLKVIQDRIVYKGIIYKGILNGLFFNNGSQRTME